MLARSITSAALCALHAAKVTSRGLTVPHGTNSQRQLLVNTPSVSIQSRNSQLPRHKRGENVEFSRRHLPTSAQSFRLLKSTDFSYQNGCVLCYIFSEFATRGPNTGVALK